MDPRTCGLLPAQGRALLSRPGVMPRCNPHTPCSSLVGNVQAVRLLKIGFHRPVGWPSMPRIDERRPALARLPARHGAGLRGIWKPPSVATAATHVQGAVLCSKAIGSHIVPQLFVTAMTRMSVGTCMCCCGTAAPHTKSTSVCMHQMHYCCMAADYCTEAQRDLPRVQRAGGCWLPRAGNLMRMRTPRSLRA